MNRYLHFFCMPVFLVSFFVYADGPSPSPAIEELKAKILFHTKLFRDMDPQKKVDVYDVIPHSSPSGEGFYSFRLFDAWSDLPENIRKNGAGGVASDDLGILWAINGQGVHLVLDTVSKKIIYQEKDKPPAPGENLDSEGGYWLHISPGGKYIIPVYVQEGEGALSFGPWIEVGTLKKAGFPLMDLTVICGGDRYIFGEFQGREGKWVLDTLKNTYTPANPEFSPWTDALAVSGDGKTIFRPGADRTGSYGIWRLPGLKKLGTVTWNDPNHPGMFNGEFSAFACLKPDLFGKWNLQSVYAVNIKTGIYRKFHFDLQDGDLRLIENDTTLQPWTDIVWELGKQRLMGTASGDNQLPGVKNPIPQNVSLIVFPDDRHNGFWIFAYNHPGFLKVAPPPLPAAAVQANPNGQDGHQNPETSKPIRSSFALTEGGPLSKAVAIYVDENLNVKRILRYDRPFEPVSESNLWGDRFRKHLCRFDSETYSVLSIDRDDNMVEFPLR